MGITAFGRAIREARESQGLNKAELARAAGIDPSYLSRIERGDPAYKGVGRDVLKQLAAALSVDFDRLDAILYDRPLPRPQFVEVPMAREVGVVAQANAGKVYSGSVIEEYQFVPLPLARGRILRGVRVQGHCMEPVIAEGDTVIIDESAEPRDGQVVVAILLDTDDVKLKRFYRHGKKVHLVPLVGEPIIVSADRVKIEGVVTEIRRRLTPELMAALMPAAAG